MKRKLEKIQKWNFKLAFRFGKILKIINARCGRRRFLRFWSTWSGVGHPEMPPSCLELNSDDFPFFRNISSTSGTKDSFFGSCYKKSSSSSSALIKHNEKHWCTVAWVTRPERPKGAKDKVKQAQRAQSRPEGLPARLLVYNIFEEVIAFFAWSPYCQCTIYVC